MNHDTSPTRAELLDLLRWHVDAGVDEAVGDVPTDHFKAEPDPAPARREAAADRALEHSTGARCLRYVIENTLLDVMYDLPSLPNATRCLVHPPSIQGDEPPTLYTAAGHQLPLPTEPLRKSA